MGSNSSVTVKNNSSVTVTVVAHNKVANAEQMEAVFSGESVKFGSFYCKIVELEPQMAQLFQGSSLAFEPKYVTVLKVQGGTIYDWICANYVIPGYGTLVISNGGVTAM